MAISMELRVLAKKLEKSSDDLLISASKKSPEIFQKVTAAIAAASTLLEGVADDMDNNASFEITPEQLDEIAALASAFDESTDPLLKKQASVLDELLLSIAAPKNALANSKKATEDEINRLRDIRRKELGEDLYNEPRKHLSAMENAEAQAKAVEQQIKRYIPMEAPLSTRYPPDRPGGQMTRISDGIYQDVVTGIVYDFKAGYKTQKGNEVPGGSVENQTRELGDMRDQGSSLFQTRDSLMGRYASDNGIFVKIATVLTSIRDYSPELLDDAIGTAMDVGLSTSQVADILASNISKDGLSALADSGKKKVKLSGINRFLSAAESAQEYENIKNVLRPLKELIDADPSHAQQWSRLISDVLVTAENAGLDQNHISLLNTEYFNNKPSFGKETVPPPSKRQTEIKRPITEEEISDTVRASSTRQSLIALALSSIQELAPHLLKVAIVKAKTEGLEDYQIKSVLSSDFNNQFEKSANEINVAESIFPHLKDLGWNDLIRKHINVMAGFGVDKKDLQKIVAKYWPSDIKSLNALEGILKNSGIAEFTAEDLGGEAESSIPLDTPVVPIATAPVKVLDPFEDESAENEQGITYDKLPDLAIQVVQKIKAGLADPKEYHKLKIRFSGKELIDTIVYYEVQQFRKSMNAEMFSEFFNMVNEWANADLKDLVSPKNKTQEQASIRRNIPAPLTTPKIKEDESVHMSPEDDLAKWFTVYNKAFDVVQEFFEKKEAKEQIQKIYEKNPEEAERIFYAAVDKIMNDNGFVGSHEFHSSGKTYFDVADRLSKKRTFGPFNPKAKEKELAPMQDETPEAFEERKRKSQVHPVTKEQLQLGNLLPEDEQELSTEIPAKNSAKNKWLKWEDYQKQWGVKISEAQAKELEDKIDEKVLANKNKLEEAFRNFVYDVDKDPESVTSLPDDVRHEVMDMLGRGESSKAILAYLTNKNIERNKNNEPTFTVPPLNDLKASRFLRVGPQKTQELKAYRKDILQRIIRRSVRDVLAQAGFENPMFEPGEDDDISFNQINIDLRNIMGEEKAKAPFFKKPPIGPDGKKLIQFWEDPTGYWEAFVAAKNHYEGYGDAERKAQDDEMVSKGYNSPDEPVFGYQTARQLLRNVDKNTIGNVLPDYKGLKTLFSDPEEYQKAFLEAQKKFSTQWREKPDEWDKIVGANENSIADIPLSIKSKILPLAVKGIRRNKLQEIADSMGIDSSTVDKIRAYVSQSGGKIRDTIMALAFSKTPFELAKKQIEETFPGAKIPWDVVEYVYPNLQSDKEDTEASQVEQNKWMEQNGFYPPYQIAVGGLGKDRESKGRFSKFPRREVPVTFASILKPQKPKGIRDPGSSGSSPSLEELKKKLSPTWNKPQAQHQPGTQLGTIKRLSPFTSKK